VANCIFCEILAGRSPVSLVYKDALCSAFMDIQPVNPGHVLVVPNHHAARLADLDSESGAQLFRVGQRITQALYASGIRCEGVNFFLADGEAAMQDVFHVHLHVLPRYAGDGFGLHFGPHYANKPDRADLDATAAALRKSLEGQQE
jgi:histidine triad (HIT) family protein